MRLFLYPFPNKPLRMRFGYSILLQFSRSLIFPEEKGFFIGFSTGTNSSFGGWQTIHNSGSISKKVNPHFLQTYLFILPPEFDYPIFKLLYNHNLTVC